jgi:Secretion system C-terminal sorting domain
MKKVIFIFIYLGFTLLQAQPNDSLRDRIWPFGQGCSTDTSSIFWNEWAVKHLDFNTSPPSLYRSCPNIPVYSFTRANICDTLGNLILTSNGCTLEDGHGGVIVHDFNIDQQWAQCPTGRQYQQAALILPRLDIPNEYVLFNGGVREITVPFGTRYFEQGYAVSLYINKIFPFNNHWACQYGIPPVLTDTLDGKILACRHANGRDWWVVMSKMYSNKYHKLLVRKYPQTVQGQNTGVDYIGSQNIGPSLYDASIGQACFSPNGLLYARVECKYNYGWGYPGMELVLMDFDRCTGDFSNPRYWKDLNPTVFGGVAFSENSRYLYASKDSFVFQMDLQASPLHFDTVAVWDGDRDTLYGFNFRKIFSVMQLAPDGKIYMGSEAHRFIHVINNPDIGGMGCNVVQGGLALGVYNNFGVPHYPYFKLGREVGSGCDTVYLRSEELRIEEGMKVWPNPAQTTLTIEVQDSGGMVEVYDLLGRQIYHSNIIGNQQVIDVSEYSKGLYLVKYSDSKGRAWCRKVVIN